MAGAWAEWLEAWGSVDLDDPELIDAGDKFIAWVSRQTMRGRGSGIQLDMPEYGWVTTVLEGKVVRSAIYTDKSEALEAAGLSE